MEKLFRYTFAIIIIAAGILFQYLQIGNEFLGFPSLGIWLIWIGFVMLLVIVLNTKKRKEDERTQMLALKASRMAFVSFIFGAFIIMIIDGINTISIPYSIFMSNLVACVVLIYFISYKILARIY